jgi:hypothetical protein
MCQISDENTKFRLQFMPDVPYINNMNKIITLLCVAIVLIPGLLTSTAGAIEMEFNLGFAYDHPLDKPLPELTDGYGYNFGTCLWFKQKYGVSLGAINTKHDLDGGIIGNQTFQVDAERDFLYLEGRYKYYPTRDWEIAGILGYAFVNNIKGGDKNGSYLEFRDSATYDSNEIGYTGAGGWVGLSAYRGIRSFNRGYFVYATMRYNFANYSKRQYYRLDQTFYLLDNREDDTNEKAKSLSFSLGVVFRFDFANF